MDCLQIVIDSYILANLSRWASTIHYEIPRTEWMDDSVAL